VRDERRRKKETAMSMSSTVRRTPWLLTGIGVGVAGVAIATLILVQSADGDATADTLAAATEEPAHVEHVEDSDIARVTLTEDAAERIGLESEPARAGGGGAGIVVPYSALLYDAAGKTWVYTRSDDLVFERAAVTVRSIRGERVLARRGPEPGTDVVVIGAAELWGAELGVGH
jgi:hypothetical protein